MKKWVINMVTLSRLVAARRPTFAVQLLASLPNATTKSPPRHAHQLERGARAIGVDASAAMHLHVVAHAPEQAIRDTRVPRERPAISAAPSSSISISRIRAEPHDRHQVVEAVVLEPEAHARSDRAAAWRAGSSASSRRPA